MVAGVEARGFLFAAPLAVKLSKPLVPLRKAGKLPYDTHRTSYALEYGEAAVEVHTDAIVHLAAGCSSSTTSWLPGAPWPPASGLVESSGGQVAGLAVLVELEDLRGRHRLHGYDFFSLVHYPL